MRISGVVPEIMETERLRFPPWRADDYSAVARFNGDPVVMRWFRAPLTRKESDTAVERMRLREIEIGFCFRPVEEKETGRIIGISGLNCPLEDLPCGPCVEIGWRFAQEAWGRGLAQEAARAWLRFGFETMELEEIVAFTVVGNRKSRRLMSRLGMVRDPADDFIHPSFEADHPLSAHVLYRLHRADWRAQMGGGEGSGADSRETRP